MSLFERLNNKRYNLQEKPSDDVVNPQFNDPENKFNQYDNVDPKELKKAKKQFKKDLPKGEKPSSSTRYPDATSKRNITKTLAPTTTGGKVQKSVDARVITKKFNQSNPNRPEYVKPDEFKAAETKTKLANPKQTRPLGQLVKLSLIHI